MFFPCSCGNTPGSDSVYQPHVDKDLISGHPPSRIHSAQLLLGVCLHVGKSLIGLRTAVELNGDLSLHQELHRGRARFSCPGCGHKRGCDNKQRWCSRAGLHCEINCTNVKMNRGHMGKKEIKRRKNGETLALGNKKTKETDWTLCSPVSDRKISGWNVADP